MSEATKKPATRKPRAKKAPATKEIQTFTLDGVTYETDSIPENFSALFSDVGVIERELQRLNTQVSITGIARQAITDRFKECLPDLTIIPTQE